MYDNLKPEQKYYLVTGGAKGLGRNIVERLLKDGKNLISISRNHEVIENTNKNLCSINCDLSNFDNTEMVFKELKAKNIEIEGLVNNAGYSEWRSLDYIDQNFVDEMVHKNLYTCISSIKFALKYFDSVGSIVNISSLAGKRGTANNSIYVASKFAVEGLTRSLSQELGARRIRVNSICPVLIQTPGLSAQIEKTDAPAHKVGIDQFMLDFAKNQTALKHLPEADDVSSLVAFLLSDSSRSITGQSINVDCGVLPG